MATVKTVYVDPSALLKLYLNEPESRAMAKWRTKVSGALVVTHHGRVELANTRATGWPVARSESNIYP